MKRFTSAFTLAEVATQVGTCNSSRKVAFTLAEVLITLGIIGVVAAVAMPVLITNINERVQKEQVRTAKYKLTLATDKMKSLGLLNETYPTTADFINELKKHFKIAKVCDNNNLRECWPTDEINLTDGTKSITDIKTGTDLEALAPGTASTTTMGIITADGTPMILVYSPICTARSSYDVGRTYTWSTIDGKPETNATTNCISAIMDINGKSKPNRLGKDVRTWNSLLGYKWLGTSYDALSYDECQKSKDKLGIKNCFENPIGTPNDDDKWGGAVKECNKYGLHLPSLQTLANVANARYGRSDISANTHISDTMSNDPNSTLPNQLLSDAHFWSASEVSALQIQRRFIYANKNHVDTSFRHGINDAFCVGD